MRSYLITGGFGVIGSSLANSLTGNITIVSRSQKNAERLQKKVKIILKDINTLTVNDLKNIDVIYHCAGTVDNYNILSDPYLDIQTNINGTIHLLECIKKSSAPPKIMYLSTFFVYGNEYQKDRVALNENSNTDPLALYPITKLSTESIIKLYSKLYKIPYVICRLTNVYAVNEDFTNKKKGGLNFLIMKAVQGEELSIYKGGNFLRDYIYVDDVVSALQFLESKASNETYLIGYGKPVLFKEIIRFVHEITGKKSKISTINPPKFHTIVGITDFVADTSKINKLGWSAQINYKQGITKIVDRYKEIKK